MTTTSLIKHNHFMQKHARKLRKRMLRNEQVHNVLCVIKKYATFTVITTLVLALISLYTNLYQMGLLEQL